MTRVAELTRPPLTPSERARRCEALGVPVRTSLAPHLGEAPMAADELVRRMREAWRQLKVFAVRLDDARLDGIERRFIEGLGDRLHGRAA